MALVGSPMIVGVKVKPSEEIHPAPSVFEPYFWRGFSEPISFPMLATRLQPGFAFANGQNEFRARIHDVEFAKPASCIDVHNSLGLVQFPRRPAMNTGKPQLRQCGGQRRRTRL